MGIGRVPGIVVTVLVVGAILGSVNVAKSENPRPQPVAISKKTADCDPHRQFVFFPGRGRVWSEPARVIVMARADDPRIADVRDAVNFWNAQLLGIGSSFFLTEPIVIELGYEDEQYVKDGSKRVVVWNADLPPPPARYEDFCGSIVIALARGDFVSFARAMPDYGMVLVGIKGNSHYPLNFPNVARNLIAHEIGHAVGLGHNANPTTLMCGRPASCRPVAYRSMVERFLPLTNREKLQLMVNYGDDLYESASR
jgi:hypothetical protein